MENTMKRLTQVILAVALLAASTFSTLSFAQYVSPIPPQNSAAPAAVPQAGVVTNPTGLTISVAPGPVYCSGAQEVIAPSQFTLATSSTYYVQYNCTTDQLFVTNTPAAQSASNLLLATVVTGTSTSAVTSITANTATWMFVTPSDSFFFVPASQCAGAVTGTAGAGNATDI